MFDRLRARQPGPRQYALTVNPTVHADQTESTEQVGGRRVYQVEEHRQEIQEAAPEAAEPNLLRP